MRLEGLYFDQKALFSTRLQKSIAMRIRLSAQSYPFPAPTGIADFSLIMPSNKTIISTSVARAAPVGMNSYTVDI